MSIILFFLKAVGVVLVDSHFPFSTTTRLNVTALSQVRENHELPKQQPVVFKIEKIDNISYF